MYTITQFFLITSPCIHSTCLHTVYLKFAGGLWNAVSGALTIKGRAFALFLKSQRQWKAKPLEDDIVDKFQAAIKDAGYHPDFILPHGSYLLNCGSPNPETLQKSREGLLDEVQRCQRLGLNRYNFHPGIERESDIFIHSKCSKPV